MSEALDVSSLGPNAENEDRCGIVTQKYTTISIPKALVNHIKDRIKGSRFQSPSAFVTHVLEELEKEIEQIGKAKGAGEEKG